MKTIIIITVCILFAGCATPMAPVPPSGTEAELAACKKRVVELENKRAQLPSPGIEAELAACKKKVADLELKKAHADNSSNIQIFDE